MIRDFARNITTLSAECDGKAIGYHKVDKQSWHIDPCTGPLEIHYQVYAWDLSVRSAHLDLTHGYFNGTSLFLRVEGQEESPCSVELLPPSHPMTAGWKVATTLPRTDARPWQFGHYAAENYDALIDHPVEMGNFDLLEFEVEGIPHAVAITGQHDTDSERLITDLEAICRHQIALFGEAPFEQYLFQLHQPAL